MIIHGIPVSQILTALGGLETAHGTGLQSDMTANLLALHPLVKALDRETPGHADVAPLIDRLQAGRSAVNAKDVRSLGTALRSEIEHLKSLHPEATGAETGPAIARRGRVPRELKRGRVFEAQGDPFVPRASQKRVVERAVAHFRPEPGKAPKKRGLARVDTGEGKTPLYSFILKALQEVLPELGDAVVILQSHQEETVVHLARTTAENFPGEGVLLLSGATRAEDLEGIRFAVGTYQQVAQAGTVQQLKKWAGGRTVLFFLDEADLVVYKGHREDEKRTPAWFQFLLDFGLFETFFADGKNFVRYNPKTPHTMIGASATLDRPDGIFLAPFWGTGNIFFHEPMAAGVRRKTLVSVVGKLVEMEIPAGQEAHFRDFTHVEGGSIIVDEVKVFKTHQSDYAVKAAVRAALDNMLMMTQGEQKMTVRKGIGYAVDTPTLLKHLHWQQDLFDLVEKIYRIHAGLRQRKRFTTSAVGSLLSDGAGGEETFGGFVAELKRFLTHHEWLALDTMLRPALENLKQGRLEGVQELFEALYNILNVEVRAVKGRPLKASAVWQNMDIPDQGGRFPNGVGDRERTFQFFKEGEIDVLWSVGMLKRGFDDSQASLIVDNAPTCSRRDVVQRAGRIMRPPNPKRPRDHSGKPHAIYVTVTANLEEHRIDFSRKDLARAFGLEMDVESRQVRITGNGPPLPPVIFDPAQLDPLRERKIHLVNVGRRTAKALYDFLMAEYGPDWFDVEIMAFDASEGDVAITGDQIDNMLKGIYFPDEQTFIALMRAWGASEEKVREMRAIFIADRSEMQVVYGSAFELFRVRTK